MHWYLRLKKFLGVAKQIENLKLSLETCEVLYKFLIMLIYILLLIFHNVFAAILFVDLGFI